MEKKFTAAGIVVMANGLTTVQFSNDLETCINALVGDKAQRIDFVQLPTAMSKEEALVYISALEKFSSEEDQRIIGDASDCGVDRLRDPCPRDPSAYPMRGDSQSDQLAQRPQLDLDAPEPRSAAPLPRAGDAVRMVVVPRRAGRVDEQGAQKRNAHKASKSFISGNDEDVFMVTVDARLVVDGKFLFELHATHGFPLSFAVDRVFSCGYEIDWVGFIEAARGNGRWDFQTHDSILHALEDAEVQKEKVKAIMDRFKVYVMRNPHPMMVGIK